MSGNVQKRLAEEWLEYALGDLKSAMALKDSDTPMRNVCYLAQQSVEKGLKALMIYYEVQIIKTHDLDVLILRLPSEVQNEFVRFDLSWLSEWSVEARYPGDWPEATKEDSLSALQIAESIINLAKKIINNECP